MNAHDMEDLMNEPLFGAPMWSGTQPFGVGWPAISGPMSLSSRAGQAGVAGFNAPQFPPAGPMTNVSGPQLGGLSVPDVFGLVSSPTPMPQQSPFGASYGSGMPVGSPAFGTSAPLAGFGAPDFVSTYGIPALLAVIAARRGQPMGPTNDQECEDLIYDALEWLPAANEVEVRCEGGRVTLTGSVPHKRLKHDVGELAWVIPAVNDVQNNVTIATKRRSRGASRETESQHAAGARKQS
jgi:hypothetical protein